MNFCILAILVTISFHGIRDQQLSVFVEGLSFRHHYRILRQSLDSLENTSSTALRSSSIILPPSSTSSNDRGDGDNKNNNEDSKYNKLHIEKSPNSNFWYTISSQPEDILPNMPYLDSDGALPTNAYQYLSSTAEDVSKFAKKQTCLITVAIDLDSDKIPKRNHLTQQQQSIDIDSIVAGMHQLIDSGLTSFQIHQNGGTSMQTWGESNIYKTLKQMTPSSVLDNCHLSTRVAIPAASSWIKDSKRGMVPERLKNDIGSGYGYGRGEQVKRDISSSLLRIETDCLDSVQVIYRNDSPYYLDTLNTLFELQEEGKIRSITGLNFPQATLQEALTNGFELDSNQASCNIVDQRFITNSPQNHDTSIKMLYSNPLMGGILSNPFYYNHIKEPSLLELSSSQRQNLNVIRYWGKSVRSKEPTHSWTLFHRHILRTLYEISRQYEVSMASVALRYLMQKTAGSTNDLSTLGSIVVGSRVGYSEQWMENRSTSLRQVFQFELEQADMERLDKVSALGVFPELHPVMKSTKQ